MLNNNIQTNNHTVIAGDQAPDFSVATNINNSMCLKDFSGKYLILYFYPKDNTPGCNAEAVDFNNALTELNNLNCSVLGVSKDKMSAHHKFAEKFALKFPLGSDENFDLCNKYNVHKEKNMYGKKVMGIERSTFIVDPKGKVLKIWRKVSVKGHVDNVIKFLKETIQS